MRAALIDGDGLVVNVIEYDPLGDYEPGDGLRIEYLGDEPVGPGWSYVGSGDYSPPPSISLTAEPTSITADGVDEAVVTYSNTYRNAPSEVEFDVNGLKVSEAVVNGRAQIAVVTDVADVVRVKAGVHEVVINGTAVQA